MRHDQSRRLKSTTVTVINEPTIYPVAQTQIIKEGLDAFLADHDITKWMATSPSSADTLAEVAGRLCYMSFEPRPGDDNEKYIQRILEKHHGSVTEHPSISFIITGVSRSLTHELVRHRVGIAISQLSQRYVDESRRVVVVPPALLRFPAAYPMWLETVKTAFDGYVGIDKILHRELNQDQHTKDWSRTRKIKYAREAARSPLPNCTETKLLWTTNARSLRHILALRGSTEADQEIQRLARMLLKIVKKIAPAIFQDMKIVQQIDETLTIVAEYEKV